MRIFSLIFLLILIGLGIGFAYLNAEPVTLHYYWGIVTLPLSLLLGFALIVGILFSMLLLIFPLCRLRCKVRRLTRVAEKQKTENQSV